MQKPKSVEKYPDRQNDCERAVFLEVQLLIAKTIGAGWSVDEAAKAVVANAINFAAMPIDQETLDEISGDIQEGMEDWQE